jgi:cellulose synthase operon protein C
LPRHQAVASANTFRWRCSSGSARPPRSGPPTIPGLTNARRLFLTGRYEEAIEIYEALNEKEPTAAALGLADCYRETGRAKQAEDGLLAACQRDPKNADLAAGAAWLAWQRGDHDQARNRAETALRLNDKHLAAHWISAELHRVSGRLDDARRGYQWFIDYYNGHEQFTPEDLRWIGLAAAQYARWSRNSDQFRFLVNTLYPQALTLDENYWPARLEMALLFLEKYNAGDARLQLDAALAINPNAAPVHAARAAVALQDFDLPTARRSLDQALAIDSQCLSAHQLRADALLAELRVDEAIAALEAARRLNPVDESTLGRLAGAYAAADGLGDNVPDSRFARLVGEVTGRNPQCGEFFVALADSLDRMRRYPDAARYYREADRRMPQLLYTRGQLGLLQMRLGDEAEARRLLDQSFRDDPFNVRVRNQLEVLDVLQGYAVLETEHFLIKYDAKHDELLARYAARYLEDQVHPAAVATFGFAPPDKSLFEIFSTGNGVSGHGWFSARMTGLPFIGTVGACAGKVVAIASPNDVGDKFNWARVLRHEYAHVVTLQQTKFAIPHWYTEALAVRFEGGQRPADWNDVLVRRAKAETLLDLETIDLGFIRPKDRDEWALAYCQAELYAEFMVARYGEVALVKLLGAYTDNLDTSAAIRRCFGVEPAEFEHAYRAYLSQVVEGLGERVPEEDALALEAGLKLKRGELAEAEELCRLGAERYPHSDRWLKSLASVYLRTGEKTKLRDTLRRLSDFDYDNWLYRKKLLELAIEAGDFEDAVRWATETLQIDVNDAEVHALLGQALGAREQYSRAIEELETAVSLVPQQADWRASLAEMYLQAGRTEQAGRTPDRDSRENPTTPDR